MVCIGLPWLSLETHWTRKDSYIRHNAQPHQTLTNPSGRVAVIRPDRLQLSESVNIRALTHIVGVLFRLCYTKEVSTRFAQRGGYVVRIRN